MAYGSARMRAFYGAGDYSTGLALSQANGYAPGYYPAGGWLSRLAGKAKGLVQKVAPIAAPLMSGIGGKLLKAVPMVGTAIAAYDIGKAAVDAFRTGSAPAHTVSIGPGGLGLSMQQNAGETMHQKAARHTIHAAARAGQVARGVKRWHGRRKARKAARRRRRGRAGDSYARAHASHRRFHHPHRRKHRRGGNVSFTTKDGRHVRFHARGDDA